jgi:autotransporter-associated beta strand protein
MKAICVSNSSWLAAALAVALSGPALAEPKIWDGGGGNASWTTPANWDNDAAPQPGDSLLFGGTTNTATVNDFTAGTLFAGFSFNADAGPFSLSGNSVALAGNANDQAVAAQKIALPLDLGGADRTFTVGPGGLLTVSEPVSGAAGLIKDGAGALALSAAATYGGATVISNGVLRVETWGAPVAGMLYWLDAAEGSTLALDASNRVSQWNDKSGNARHFSQTTGTMQPLYVPAVFGAMPGLRFDGVDDRLVLAASTSPQTVFIVNRVATGGSLRGIWGLNQADTGIRMTSATAWQHPGNVNDFSNPSGSVMYVNGAIGKTFTAGSVHLLEVERGSAATLSATGLGDYFYVSGVAPRPYSGDIAEAIAYGRALSTEERQQVESYLMSKWMGAGDGAATNLLPAATAVQIAGSAATLELANVNQSIGSLSGAQGGRVVLSSATLAIGGGGADATFNGVIEGFGSLVKEGAGALTLGGTNSYAGSTGIRGGTLRLAPAATGPTAPATGSVFWVDAANEASIVKDGSGKVSRWNDSGAGGGPSFASQANAALQPTHVPNALNGKPVVDFGPYSGDGSGAETSFQWLGFDAQASTIRTVFWVGRGQNFILGDDNNYHFHRGAETATSPIWHSTYTHANIRGGQTYLNGALVNGTSIGLPDDYAMVSLVATGNVEASRLVCDRTFRAGGQKVAEIVIYNRVLSDAERLATQTYLSNKWFGASSSDLLPASTLLDLSSDGATLDLNGVNQTLGSLAGVAGSQVMLGAGMLAVGEANASTRFDGVLSGSGSLIKQGTGVLILGGSNNYSGATFVNGGVLKLSAGASIDSSSSFSIAANALLDVSATPGLALGSGERLTGSGSVTGMVIAASGAVIAPGSGAGALTLQSGLTLIGGAAIEAEIATPSDLVRIAGGTLTGPATGTVRIDLPGASSSGTYTILDWTGAVATGVDSNDFALGTVPSGYVGTLRIAGSTLQVSLAPAGPQDVGTNTIATLRSAIEDLAERYPDDYGPKAPDFLARLAAIEAAFLAGVPTANFDYQVLKREALVVNNPALAFNRLMFVRRNSGDGLSQNWQSLASVGRSSCNDQIAMLDVSHSVVSNFYTPDLSGYVGFPNLHWNGDRMLFTRQVLTNGARAYAVFEIKLDGTGLQQVSPAAGSDIDWYDACYLPNEDVLMCSTAPFAGVPCVGGADYVANMYRLTRSSGAVRQLTFDQDQNWGPTVLEDGRVMFTRWEYSDTPHYFSRVLFTMMPDGLEQFARYGSGSYWPNALFDAKPIPGKPSQFVGIVSGHHGVRHEGEMILFDETLGTHEADGVVHRYCGPNPVQPQVIDSYVDVRNPWPRFVQPAPLDEKQLVVSARTSSGNTWGIYLVDQFDNITLLHYEAGKSLMHPTPVRQVPTPPLIPDRVRTNMTVGTVNIADIHFGPGLRDVPRGKVKSLRLYTFHYGYRGMGGHANVAIDGGWDVKRIIGTVPVEADGSASFTAPANTPISIQPLDEEGKALQAFRSWYTVMPGETVSCSGCHENRNDGMLNRASLASRKEPASITPWLGPERGFNFQREVQPVLDRYCTGCHGGPGGATNVPPNLYTTNRVGYSTYGFSTGNPFPASYLALHPYVKRTGNEGYFRMNNPGEYHADNSELVQILQKGHYGVQLDTNAWDRLITWIDLNVPAWGIWGEHANPGANRTRRMTTMRDYASVTNDPEAYPLPMPARPAFEMPSVPPPVPPATPPPGSVFNASEARARRNAITNDLAPAELSVDLGGGISLVLNLVPTGAVLMGSATAYPDEAPQTAVTIDRPFYVAKFEIMNKQYALFDPEHRSGFVQAFGKDHNAEGWTCEGSNQPAIRVSWAEAMKYCEWLTKKTGRKFTLPTEAQWEYACRAGTAGEMWYGAASTRWTNVVQAIPGDSFYRSGPLANLGGFEYHNNPTPGMLTGSPRWFLTETNVTDSWVATGNADLFASNPFGLCGMHGNAAEWTLSTYAPYPYDGQDGRNRAVYDTNEWQTLRKVVRGGSALDRPKRATSSFRTAMPAWERGYNVGFRVVAEVDTATPAIPAAMFVASPTNGVTDLAVAFDGSSSTDADGTILKFAWDFGDGGAAEGSSLASHTYTVPGRYTVTLTVTDNDGYTAATSAAVAASARIGGGAAPVAAFTMTPSTGPAPCRVRFDAGGSSDADGAVSAWYWDFGDGAIGSGPVAEHTYPETGRFAVSLTVVDNSGLRDTERAGVLVTGAGGNEAPAVDAGLPALAVAGESVALDGTVSDDGLPSAPGAVTTVWSKLSGPGDVSFADPAASDTAALFGTTGTYVLQLAASDGEVASRDTVTITVLAQAPYHSPIEVAWSADGALLAAADETARSVALIDPAAASLLRTVPLAGEPRDVVWQGANRLFVSEHGAGTVAEVDAATGAIVRRIPVGPQPSGLAMASGKGLLLVADRGLDKLSIVDLASGEIRSEVSMVREPLFVTVTPDEKLAVVANGLPYGDARDPSHAAAISFVNLDDLSEVDHVKLPAGATVVRKVVCSADGRWAYVVHVQGRPFLPTTQLSRGWVITSALSIIDLESKQVYATVLFDETNDGAPDPWGLALSADGSTLWVTLAGVHEIATLKLADLHAMLAGDAELRAGMIYNLTTLHALEILTRTAVPGVGTRGLAIAPAGGQLAVAAYFSGSVLLLNPDGSLAAEVPLGTQPPATSVRRGERLYYDGTGCYQRWLSCNSCHPGARADGMNWDLLNDGFGNSKNTKSHVFAPQTPPSMWTGIRANAMVGIQAGFKFIQFQAHPQADYDDILAFMTSLEPEPSPFWVAGKLTPDAVQGKALFESPQTRCLECHRPDYHYGDSNKYVVGTAHVADWTQNDATGYVAAPLHELWRTGPFLHDGSAATMREVLTTFNAGDRHGVTSHLTPNQIDQLAAYLLQLGGEMPGGPTNAYALVVNNGEGDGSYLPGSTVTIAATPPPGKLFVRWEGGSINNPLAATATLFMPESDLAVTAVYSGIPTLSDIADQATEEDTATAAIPFTVADDDTPASDLLVTAASSDPVLLPDGNIVLAGSGADRNITLNPAPDRFGEVTVTVTVSDGVDSASDEFVLTVLPVNDTPVPADDTATLPEDGSASIGVLANDSDIDGDGLAIQSITQGESGAVTDEGNGMLRYIPAANWNGSDSFAYTIGDGHGGTAGADVHVTVTPVNDPPVAAGDTAVTDRGVAVTVAVLANDSDIDGGALSVQSFTQGTHGSVTGNGASLVYAPLAGQYGTDAFTYTVSDGAGGTDVGTVNVTIRGPLPAGWTSQDIGPVGLAGRAAYWNGEYAISGSGTGIGAKSDQCRVAWQPMSADGSIVARITGMSGTSTGSIAGVMIRESSAAGSRYSFMGRRGSGALVNLNRTSASKAPSVTTAGTSSLPVWVRVERVSSTLRTYRSADGISWTLVTSQKITMASQVYVGFVTSSGTNTRLDTAVFDSVILIP